MIVDIVRSKGVPFRCNKCNTYFVWKPDEHGECRVIRTKHRQCKNLECEYYEPARKKCPECGSDDLTEIRTMVYKIMREIRR